MVREDMGEQDKALKCLIVAAHLSPPGFEEWKGLAERSRFIKELEAFTKLKIGGKLINCATLDHWAPQRSLSIV